MPAFLPKEAQDLIHKMITVDVSKRITMQGIKEHAWFNSNSPSPQHVMSLVSVEEMVRSNVHVVSQTNIWDTASRSIGRFVHD